MIKKSLFLLIILLTVSSLFAENSFFYTSKSESGFSGYFPVTWNKDGYFIYGNYYRIVDHMGNVCRGVKITIINLVTDEVYRRFYHHHEDNACYDNPYGQSPPEDEVVLYYDKYLKACKVDLSEEEKYLAELINSSYVKDFCTGLSGESSLSSIRFPKEYILAKEKKSSRPGEISWAGITLKAEKGKEWTLTAVNNEGRKKVVSRGFRMEYRYDSMGFTETWYYLGSLRLKKEPGSYEVAPSELEVIGTFKSPFENRAAILLKAVYKVPEEVDNDSGTVTKIIAVGCHTTKGFK